jgi:hypothetical protein
MKTAAESTGLTGQDKQGCRSERPATAAPARNIPGATWIDDEAVADTIRVWAPYYGGKLTEAEAVEILMNVKNLVEVLVQAGRKARCKTA